MTPTTATIARKVLLLIAPPRMPFDHHRSTDFEHQNQLLVALGA